MRVSLGRMHYDTGLLVYKDKIVVFIDDVERDILRLKIACLFRESDANDITDPRFYIAGSRCSVQIYQRLILHLCPEPRGEFIVHPEDLIDGQP